MACRSATSFAAVVMAISCIATDASATCRFKAKKDKNGFTTFEPHEVDDDSGIGTQFATEDVNGDGLLDCRINH